MPLLLAAIYLGVMLGCDGVLLRHQVRPPRVDLAVHLIRPVWLPYTQAVFQVDASSMVGNETTVTIYKVAHIYIIPTAERSLA